MGDYDGQRLAELLYYWIIICFGAAGWVWGYIEKNFKYTFYCWAVGVGISVLLCVPDWPIYNRHTVEWRESCHPGSRKSGTSGGAADSSKSGKKKKTKNKTS